MTDLFVECIRSSREFQALRDDWETFMGRHFPEKYGRSHPWLSAIWNSYHHGKTALIYLQRHQGDRRIVAAAPLVIKRDVYCCFPVLSLQTLGMGIGGDDFLLGPEAQGFVSAVFRDLAKNHRWHVARFSRISSPRFLDEIRDACETIACTADISDSQDYFIEFPSNYQEYQQSRSRKFRRNLNQALNRLEREGAVSLETLDPFADIQRVKSLGREIAHTCWQYREGKSHFNENGAADFYTNLAGTGHGPKGEEFSVLTVGGRPVAYLLGCRRGRTYYAVDTAFHADYRHVSAGRILFGMIFKRLIEDGGVDYFDFEGSGDYKDDYATHARTSQQLVVYNASLYPLGIRSLKRSKLYTILKNRQGRRSGVIV
ncbi:MAG TPA: GNAT family N-acetyltransferase [Geobacteraceae bacterium]